MSVKLIYDRIRKRDGRIVEFDAERITLAVNKALKAVGTSNEKLAKTICTDVVTALNGIKVKENIPDIELIQDLVEQAFIRKGLTKAAKSYIL